MRQIKIPQRLMVLVMLAQMLEGLDRSSRPVGAEQYRSVAEHLMKELAAVEHDGTLEELLTAFPAMSELYENVNYEYAGLCLSPLDAALASEMEARAALSAAAQRIRG